MGIYSDLTDEALAAEIAAYRAARKEMTLGQGVAVIAGEGRRVEFTKANRADLDAELRALIREQDKRAGRRGGGRAIEVHF